MVIGIIGENCTGKSTLAEALAARIGAEIITGKDYLRMAKSESMAKLLFKKRLAAAVDGENLIYVITESEHLELLPEGAVRVLVKADLNDIKERFKARMRGVLPPPVEQMLERRHGAFDNTPHDHEFNSSKDELAGFVDSFEKV
jgi:deoxyadenosine/deoxycytidine kinase